MCTADNSSSAVALKVDRLINEAFFPGRSPRSPEYRAGCRAALEYRLARHPILAPCVAGTAAADAFFAGVEEGHAIWQSHCSRTVESNGYLSTGTGRRNVLSFQGIGKAEAPN